MLHAPVPHSRDRVRRPSAAGCPLSALLKRRVSGPMAAARVYNGAWHFKHGYSGVRRAMGGILGASRPRRSKLLKAAYNGYAA
jgi:hypothetical protein